ncbi:hydantoinase/carbamoylase family amidase [Kaistia geumhonensis]|uniref:N-carbamoyl-L-amino-acid hydrolase n=1 Tax=Kaistia geumhonensis TaxID=410839 RepID=A0ABU0M5F6_9HYPH|nr:hydantoinase/carbamoylase family amidase [Kaistia geumhonensis]MCX5478590.1 hydantoinase/carbamoylase family amidase [Kaistia geumhonensis]MDQ0516192.1 N-carbamoyl-L-amino-acid hydrolase [Kaistia geumhonensis]
MSPASTMFHASARGDGASVPRIDGARLIERIAAFAALGGLANGGVNRPAFSQADRAARALVASIAAERGFRVFQDPIANLFLARPGAPDLPPLLIGSHLDSQPTGGRFDGALGTLAALSALEAIEDQRIATGVPVELVVWANEEGSRFSPGTMGSQAFARRALPDAGLRDADGVTLGEALAATRDALPGAAERPLGFPIAGYLELHIEQGPILEAAGLPIGVVEAVQGALWLEVTVTGETAHAGTTPLAARHDAVAALVEALARLGATVMEADPAARLTIGRLASEPDSINAVPRLARCTIDLRHPDASRLAQMRAEVEAAVAAAAAGHGCAGDIRPLFSAPPTAFDPMMADAIAGAAARLGLGSMRMVSGAFHDALPIAGLAPAAMIFVPCRGGVSHNEREHVEPAQCIAGADVLLGAAIEAAQGLARGASSADRLQRDKRNSA